MFLYLEGAFCMVQNMGSYIKKAITVHKMAFVCDEVT